MPLFRNEKKQQQSFFKNFYQKHVMLSHKVSDSVENNWFNIELIIFNILEFMEMRVDQVIKFSQVCSSWRRVCRLEKVSLEFSNRFPNIINHRMKEHSLEGNFENLQMLEIFSRVIIYLPLSGSIAFIRKFTKCKDLEIRFTHSINWDSIDFEMERIESLKLVCKFTNHYSGWLNSVIRIFPNLKHLTLKYLNVSTSELVQYLFPKLETFELYTYHSNYVDPIENYIDSNSLYEKMDKFTCVFDYGPQATRWFPNEKNFPNLRSIFTQTNQSSVTFQNLTQLKVVFVSVLEKSNFPNLLELSVDPMTTVFEDISIPATLNAPKLKYINMKSQHIDMKNLDRFQNLEKLEIQSTSLKELSILEKLPNLKDISISAYFGPDSFAKLSKQMNFIKLKVKPEHGYDNKPYLTIEDLKYISKLKCLEHLEINLTNEEQFHLFVNSDLPNLTTLYLTNILSTEHLMQVFQSKFYKLKKLSIIRAEKPVTKLFKKYSLPDLKTVKLTFTPFKTLKPLLKSPFIQDIKFESAKRDLLKLNKYCEKNKNIDLVIEERIGSQLICKISKLNIY